MKITIKNILSFKCFVCKKGFEDAADIFKIELLVYKKDPGDPGGDFVNFLCNEYYIGTNENYNSRLEIVHKKCAEKIVKGFEDWMAEEKE